MKENRRIGRSLDVFARQKRGMTDNKGRGSLCHSSACAARQAVRESLFSASRFKRTYAASESGRSMVEMLGVLAVIAVLSAGALAGYSQAMKKVKLNKTVEQLQLIFSNIKSKNANSRRVKISSLEEAIKMGIFPEEMVKSATELQPNQYKGEIIFEKVQLENKKEVYKISFKGLPPDVAIALATMDWKNSSVLKVTFNEAEE